MTERLRRRVRGPAKKQAKGRAEPAKKRTYDKPMTDRPIGTIKVLTVAEARSLIQNGPRPIYKDEGRL